MLFGDMPNFGENMKKNIIVPFSSIYTWCGVIFGLILTVLGIVGPFAPHPFPLPVTVLFILVGLIITLISYHYVKNPKAMLEFRPNGLYISNQKKEIPYRHIVSASFVRRGINDQRSYIGLILTEQGKQAHHSTVVTRLVKQFEGVDWVIGTQLLAFGGKGPISTIDDLLNEINSRSTGEK